jgi:prepilin-type N-terminal cleavage/methylation domain-containing protein
MLRANSGLTLIEVLVSLVLVSTLGFVASGLLIPLKLTRTTSIESQATALSRSYLELLKGRWLDDSKYSNPNDNLPITCAVGSTTSPCDLKIPSDWTLGIDATTKAEWEKNLGKVGYIPDRIRLVKVVVTAPNSPSVTFSTLVTKP